MRCLRLIFSWFMVVTLLNPSVVFGNDENMDDGLIYIEPEVARIVIERTFANMVSEYSADYTSELDNITILKNVIDAYNNMLEETGGYVSATGINRVCLVAFQSFKPKDLDALTMLPLKRRFKCLDFAESLVTTHVGEKDCVYSIKKVGGSQMNISYTSKTSNTGFNRKGGAIAWRFLNPGALRDSPYKCVIINTKPNGKFAAFDSYEKGRFAIRWLLENGRKYQNVTPREAIPMYAPEFENDTKQYIIDLGRQGVDVDKKLSELTEPEWDKLIDAISQIEGWNKQGEITEF